MAVYTDITDAELAAFLEDYDLGRPVALSGIAEGVENSNFLLDTHAGRFILTIYERRVRHDELPYFLELMHWVAAHGFTCPTPQCDRAGRALKEIRGKPAALVSFMQGRSICDPGLEHCRAAGYGLAMLHQAGAGFPRRRANDLGQPAWRGLLTPCRDAAERLRPGLAADLLADLKAIEADWPTALPSGLCHADFFPDNVFFEDDRFAGAIDFYFACDDFYAYDLAVAINAWTFVGGSYDPARVAAMIAGYDEARALTAAERAALGVLVRGSAMRFFLTRLIDWEATPAGALVVVKDPMEYEARLATHRVGGGCAWVGAEL